MELQLPQTFNGQVKVFKSPAQNGATPTSCLLHLWLDNKGVNNGKNWRPSVGRRLLLAKTFIIPARIHLVTKNVTSILPDQKMKKQNDKLRLKRVGLKKVFELAREEQERREWHVMHSRIQGPSSAAFVWKHIVSRSRVTMTPVHWLEITWQYKH